MVWLVLAGTVSQAIGAAVQVGIPQALASGPLNLDELAARCGAHRGQLARLMRALTGFGVFAHDHEGAFALTSLGETLLTAESDGTSLAGLALFAGSGWLADARVALAESVRTGDSAFRCAHGTDLYGAMREHADLAALWEGWSGYGAGVDVLADPVVAGYDFSAARHVVDVGGRYGALLAPILQANPGVEGTLFDLPDTAQEARARLHAQGLDGRCRVMSGSFFDAVPEGGDLYLLSNVIDDWDDDRAIAILRNCRAAMTAGALLLVIEPIFAEAVLEGQGVAVLDLWMMVHSGAMRTQDDIGALMGAAGFDVRRVIATSSAASTILEAAPA
jgi:C-methyltransferase